MSSSRDPVCGMNVEPSRAAGESTYGGRRYLFCSDTCRRAFEADPGRYAAEGTQRTEEFEPERHEPPHTTTGPFTAPKFGSAGSGGAELEPGPERHGPRSEGKPGKRKP